MARAAPKAQRKDSDSNIIESGETSNLMKRTIRLHPDVIKAAAKKAAAEGRHETDIYREWLSRGMQAAGIYL